MSGREDRDLDELLREGAPAPAPEAARRVVGDALARLERRRHRVLAIAASSVLGAAAAIVIVAILATTTAPPAPGNGELSRDEPGASTDRDAEPRRRVEIATSSDRDTETRKKRARFERRPGSLPNRVLWMLREHGDDELREMVGEALADARPREIDALRGAIRGPAFRAGSRERLVRALDATAGEAAWPVLEAVLETYGPDPVTVDACGRIGDPRAVRALRAWTMRPDPVGDAAVIALGRIGGPEATRTLVDALRAASSPLGGLMEQISSRRSAIVAELRHQRAELLDELRRAIDGGRQVAEVVAAVSAALPGEAARELETLLQDAGPRARSELLRGLAELRTPDATAALIRALEDPALARDARRYLARLARRDLGPRPSAWRLWLDESSLRDRDDGRAAMSLAAVVPDPDPVPKTIAVSFVDDVGAGRAGWESETDSDSDDRDRDRDRDRWPRPMAEIRSEIRRPGPVPNLRNLRKSADRPPPLCEIQHRT